jgi:hypothetical protein
MAGYGNGGKVVAYSKQSFVVFRVANSRLVDSYIRGWLANYGGEES